ncbi:MULTISPECIES: hypothetical protein [unclassified Coleofasciculus]|uniref:hypothetical protein n=1 Tax=unclassified Coleofasciculus TaxID=2692782 RepID=UPI00187E3CEA|nr:MULTISPECIES: hypothetical protein [unclassified Coleofasciculus]MBE9128596.1 hypothetical protein [Coleofasciculus sp. LEGE 07081]MBE9150686.1 hypothetical protein [Coleofasciculus sp. LEGE 07092]
MNLLPLHTLITHFEDKSDNEIIELIKWCHNDPECWSWIVEQVGFDPYEEEESSHEDDESWTEKETYFSLAEFLACDLEEQLSEEIEHLFAQQ